VRELEEHFTCFGDEQNAFVFPIGELFWMDRCRVAKAEVNASARFQRDAGGQGDARAWFFHAVLLSADAVNMRRMGQDTPGILLETIPLFEEIIAAVVAHF
jgi:hypothetical protein